VHPGGDIDCAQALHQAVIGRGLGCDHLMHEEINEGSADGMARWILTSLPI